MDLRGDDGGFIERFDSPIDDLASVPGHADRHEPFGRYGAGLLPPGARKSVEPMAARLSPDQVSAEHRSLPHFVGQSPWSSKGLLAALRGAVLPALEARGPVEA